MPTKITPAEGELLQKISEEKGFKTMQIILQANPGLAEKIIENKGRIPANTEITVPDKEAKNEVVEAGKAKTFVTGPAINMLRIQVLYKAEDDENVLEGWDYELAVKKRGENVRLKSGRFGEDTFIQVEGLFNDEIYDGDLLVSKNKGQAGSSIEIPIDLKIYPFYFFQEYVDAKSKKQMDREDRNKPLFISRRVTSKRWIEIETSTKFTDPAEPPITSRVPLGDIKLRKKQFNVFLQDAKNTNNYTHNIVRIDFAKFVFLDTGCWLTDARDFGMIWGKHIYLCTYKEGVVDPNPNAMLMQRGGMDRQFFDGMGKDVFITKWATIDWLEESEFDWDNIYLIVPDMHLMTVGKSLIWRDSYYDGDEAKKNELETRHSETLFAEFMDQLLKINALQGKTKLVQIGDLYDLWVGYGVYNKDKVYDRSIYDYLNKEPSELRLFPLFKDRIGQQDIVLENPDSDIEKISEWINKIRGAGNNANPALKALATFTTQFPNNSFYIYGNHDSYLKLPAVCAAGGLPGRVMNLNGFKSIFMEHGQRMETFYRDPLARTANFVIALGDRFPGNSDGDSSGFVATNLVYLAKKNEYGINVGAVMSLLPGLDFHDASKKWLSEGNRIDSATRSAQRQYSDEHAAIWIHRQSTEAANPAHIFVIGHTHMPELWVCAVKLE